MTEFFGTLLQVMLTALGAVPVPDAMLAGGMLGIAAIFVALTALTIALAVVAPHTRIRSAPHPRRAIDVSTLLAQSDPDAAGHPRPRAPGVTLAA